VSESIVASRLPVPPSGTGARFAALLLAVVASSLAIYLHMYGFVPGKTPRAILMVTQCQRQRDAELPAIYPARSSDDIDRMVALGARMNRCTGAVYVDEGLWVGGGMLGLATLAGVLYALWPIWTFRRRRLVRLSAGDVSDFVADLDELRLRIGLKRAPVWLLAPYARTINGQAFGLPWRRYVCLDAGLVTLHAADRSAFEAIVLHELAHLRNRDVDLTYLSMSLWWAFVVAALAPTIALAAHPLILVAPQVWRPDLVAGDLSGNALLSLSIVSLVALVFLTRNSVLRAREVRADAVAAAYGSEAALAAVIRRLPAPAGRGWSRPLDIHPQPERRLAIINDPDRLTRASLWQLAGYGLGIGVVSGNLSPIRFILFGPSALGAGMLGLLIGGLAVPMLAVTILATRAARRPPVAPSLRIWIGAPIALVLGFLAGELVSAYAAITSLSGVLPFVPFAFTALLLLVGSVLLVRWLWSVMSGCVDLRPDRRSWMIPVLVAATIVAVLPWLIWWLQLRDFAAPTVASPLQVGERIDTLHWGESPPPGVTIGWYIALARFADLTIPGIDYLTYSPIALLSVVLVWMLPAIASSGIERRLVIELRSAIATGLVGALAVGVIGVLVAVTLRLLLPAEVRHMPSDATNYDGTFVGQPFVVVFDLVLVAVSVLVQALIAGIIAVRTRHGRLIRVMVATFVVAVLGAVILNDVVVLTGNCIDLTADGTSCFSNGPIGFAQGVGRQWLNMQFPLQYLLPWSLIKGAMIWIPVACVVAALGSLTRRLLRNANTAGPVAAPAKRSASSGSLAFPSVVLGALLTLDVAAALVGLPRANGLWWADAWSMSALAADSTAAPDRPAPGVVSAVADPCVVGTWTETYEWSDVKLREGTVRFTGRGVVQRFHEDGTGAIDFGDANVRMAVSRGHFYEFTSTGTWSWQYDARDGIIKYSHAASTASMLLGIDGKVGTPVSIHGDPTPDHYKCFGDRMTQWGATYRIELTRRQA
jgi:Zn-dependent protease with chaperone function